MQTTCVYENIVKYFKFVNCTYSSISFLFVSKLRKNISIRTSLLYKEIYLLIIEIRGYISSSKLSLVQHLISEQFISYPYIIWNLHK